MEELYIYPWAITTAYMLLISALAIATWRLIYGPSLFDRVVAMDLISAVVMCIASVFAIETRNSVFLEISVAIAIVTFLGTIAFARYLEDEEAE
ncbi:monovalent cation/H+ antiporter complex subunit F [Lentisphaera profundi]|uniref:Monovalent cation/H+ antiporter complex subunit F n=1 Tax=Lentisphaera profundi TaxID=1658616 RepID=A0ABY7VQH1_9BACT|nr:monovalent cation/H+ antiporter complex subunit F [Lentisphaera profundi]WDE95453.1 monovalent cation/H+ antiporter complex subunit F [Lentisphaera profundi]